MPTTVSMSSLYNADLYPIDNCIDGNEEVSFCMTQREPSPWIALDYGTEVRVSSVVVIARNDPSFAYRTENMNIRVSSTLPVSSSEMFTGGQLLGIFEERATQKQRIEITGGTELTGRYVVVQMDHNPGENHLNIMEVTAWGQGRSFISY